MEATFPEPIEDFLFNHSIDSGRLMYNEDLQRWEIENETPLKWLIHESRTGACVFYFEDDDDEEEAYGYTLLHKVDDLDELVTQARLKQVFRTFAAEWPGKGSLELSGNEIYIEGRRDVCAGVIDTDDYSVEMEYADIDDFRDNWLFHSASYEDYDLYDPDVNIERLIRDVLSQWGDGDHYALPIRKSELRKVFEIAHAECMAENA